MKKNFALYKTNPFFIFCNKILNRGLKFSAYRRFIFILTELKFQLKKNNAEILNLIFCLLEIYIYIFRKKIGANIHLIPLYVKKNNRLNKGLSNFIRVLKNRKEKNFSVRILNELIDVIKVKSSTITIRNNIYMTAAEEKANLRFMRPRIKRPPINVRKLIRGYV